MNKSHYDVLVIGGGASGLMAAATAAEAGKHVLLLEQNTTLGKKLAITGGGRCNIMNAESDVHTLLEQYGDAKKFLYSPFASFGMTETKAYFTDRGLPLKTEDRQRMFPVSEKASDVVTFFENLLKKHAVHIRTNETVKELLHEKDNILGVRTNTGCFTASKYILATGGLSHPETGSTGDGHRWLHTLGHTVHEPDPALVPLVSPDTWVHRLSGTTLEHARITFKNSGGTVTKTGRILFTHFGLSGPTIINAAADVRTLLTTGPVDTNIDLFPDIDDAVFREQILNSFTANSNKTLRNTVKSLVPPGTSNAILTQVPTALAETKTHSITKADRQKLVSILRSLPLTITGTKGNDWSVVANGGLDLTEVDTRSMCSKLYKNLYFTGDILHITRPTGGYSLQLCWTTGAVAGMQKL